ncbi:SgcJ/EcaC family oxidoreductase [Singulisphaera sp. Ch08]|uniref:SgcJ/EcaC family oxidoreductase n=1 Tax=Singulisphaera sp. Ch08 TaxID=3120278 RepID=A0AAU7CDX7_9BACT
MRVSATFLGGLALSATLGLVVAQDRPVQEPAPAAGPTAASKEREADAQAITELLAAFVKAYNARDAKALGNLFLPDAEIEDDDGEITSGRDAIVERFSSTFGEGKRVTLSVNTESLRFLGTDLAIEEGTATLTGEPDDTLSSNRYSVIYARQDGRWFHSRIRDEPPDEVSPHERLTELEWMLGEWVNESDNEIVYTQCKWADEGNFLLREFDVKIEGRIALRGTQRIGWDEQQKQFRMWVFDDNGGFAEGLLARDDDRWVIKGSGVRSDGQSVSFTNVITVLGKDQLRWEVFDRTVGGVAIPNTDRFEVVRRAPLPGD